MQRLLMSLLLLTFFTSSIAQNNQQESIKKEFHEGLYTGCIEKQSQNQSQLTTNSKFNTDVCSCYAKNTIEKIFSNLDFQIALKKRDDSAIKTTVSQIVTKDKSAITFQQCLNMSQDKFKADKKPIFEKPTTELSTKRGLHGESRESFIRGGVIECIEAAKSSSPNIQAYCSCSVGSMADNVSQRDLYELGINSSIGQRKMKEMGELGMKRCSHLLK